MEYECRSDEEVRGGIGGRSDRASRAINPQSCKTRAPAWQFNLPSQCFPPFPSCLEELGRATRMRDLPDPIDAGRNYPAATLACICTRATLEGEATAPVSVLGGPSIHNPPMFTSYSLDPNTQRSTSGVTVLEKARDRAGRKRQALAAQPQHPRAAHHLHQGTVRAAGPVLGAARVVADLEVPPAPYVRPPDMSVWRQEALSFRLGHVVHRRRDCLGVDEPVQRVGPRPRGRGRLAELALLRRGAAAARRRGGERAGGGAMAR